MLDEELTAAIQAVRAAVRARHPGNGLGLEGVASGGPSSAAARPRRRGSQSGRHRHRESAPPGLKNNIAQWFKKKIARVLDWHVREQVEFNRAAMRCVQASLEALGETQSRAGGTGFSQSGAARGSRVARALMQPRMAILKL